MPRPSAATIRRISQGLFLAAFLALLATTVWPLGFGAPVDLFVQSSPLVALTATLAAKAWLPETVLTSLVVVILALVAGRAYCGWICPLGTTIDLTDRVFFARVRPRPATARRAWKFYVLCAVAISALLGAQLGYFVDPIVLLTRSLTLGLLAPIAGLIAALDQVSVMHWRLDLSAVHPLLPPSGAVYRMGGVALVMLVVVLALGAVEKRFWCRNLCPLGALLGLLSRVSVIRRRVDARCTKCLRCVRRCPTGAIPGDDPTTYGVADCIQCHKCVAVCPERAVSFLPRTTPAPASAPLDLSRRRLLTAGALGVGWAAGVRLAPLAGRGRARDEWQRPQLIRPPGAVSEAEFVERCVRCQQCVKACPTNGLQPALSEAGVAGLWSPVLVPRIGPCSEKCNLCSHVCPTNAIEPIRVEDKPLIKIGRAHINRSQCIMWSQGKACLVCAEVCPYIAVHEKKMEGKAGPVVNNHACTGCGECEKNCPVQPLAAIRVFSLGDRRHVGATLHGRDKSPRG